jgi:hydrogenase maturation protease
MSSGLKRVLIAGLGNEILKDDGVGIHAIRLLQELDYFSLRSGIRVAEIGTALLDAAHLYEWAECMVAIDAMMGGNRPGTVYLLQGLDFGNAGLRNGGLHQLDLQAALRLVPECRIKQVAVVGVEPKEIDFGLELTHPVRAALPELMQVIDKIVQRLQSSESPFLTSAP